MTSASSCVRCGARSKRTGGHAADWTGRTPWALKIRATGQLNGALDRVSGLVKLKVPVWDGAAWEAANTATRNPAALMRAYWRGWSVGDERLAGMHLEDAAIDDAALGEWHDFCELHSLTCSLVLDAPIDDDAMMRIIGQCGWATLDRQDGLWSVIWENENEPVSSIVSPANIVAGSISSAWNHEGLADEVIVDFVDAESGYEPNTLRRRVDLNVIPQMPATVRLIGVTDGEAAARECNRAAAAQVFHTRTHAWDMPAEGLLLRRGHVIALAHDLVGGTAGGRLRTINVARTGLRVSPGVAAEGTVWIWDLHGNVHSSAYTGTGETIVLDDALPAAPEGVDDDPLSYRWTAFASTGSATRVRITGTEPGAGGRSVRFTARDEVPDYYLCPHVGSDASADRTSAGRGRTARAAGGRAAGRLAPIRVGRVR